MLGTNTKNKPFSSHNFKFEKIFIISPIEHLMDAATAAAIIIAITSLISIFLIIVSRDKRLYFAIEQSANIMDIKDNELKNAIKIQLIDKGMVRTINNLYTTKIKIVNMGFAHIDNPKEYPIIIAFDEESEVISCKEEENLENRGIKTILHPEKKNVIEIHFTGFNRKESAYFEIICVNGKSELPSINTPYKPLKTKRVRGFDKEEAKLEKDKPKSLLIIFPFFLIFNLMLLILSIFESRGNIIYSIISSLIIALVIFWSIFKIREINLLTFPSHDEIKLTKIPIPIEK